MLEKAHSNALKFALLYPGQAAATQTSHTASYPPCHPRENPKAKGQRECDQCTPFHPQAIWKRKYIFEFPKLSRILRPPPLFVSYSPSFTARLELSDARPWNESTMALEPPRASQRCRRRCSIYAIERCGGKGQRGFLVRWSGVIHRCNPPKRRASNSLETPPEDLPWTPTSEFFSVYASELHA